MWVNNLSVMTMDYPLQNFEKFKIMKKVFKVKENKKKT